MSTRYPIIVTGTTKWCVWVAADSLDEAYEFVAGCPSDHVEGEQPFDGWIDAQKPDAMATQDVYYCAAPDNDAHVRTHDSVMPQHDAHVRTHALEMRMRARRAEIALVVELPSERH